MKGFPVSLKYFLYIKAFGISFQSKGEDVVFGFRFKKRFNKK
jgi:hypothetical protein